MSARASVRIRSDSCGGAGCIAGCGGCCGLDCAPNELPKIEPSVAANGLLCCACGGARLGVQHVDDALDRGVFGGLLDVGAAFFADHADRGFGEIADHRLDVAPDVADLGVLRRLDLDERRTGERCEAPRDLGLADAGRSDHQDVLRDDLAAQLFRQLFATVAVAQRDRDRALGAWPGRRCTCRARRRSGAGVRSCSSGI